MTIMTIKHPYPYTTRIAMKKSLLTLAILGTATLSAHAGLVLYGEVDAGFSFN